MGCSIFALKIALCLNGPRITAVIRKISVGAGGKHTLSPEESLRPSVKTTLTMDRARANTCAITAAKTRVQ